MAVVANSRPEAGNRDDMIAAGQPGMGVAKRPLASLLTTAGRGAIAVIRVSGPGAVRVADAVFRPHRGLGLAQTAPGRIRLGRIGRGAGDEVVAVVLDEAVEAVEFQCHGGLAATELVMAALEEAGVERSGRAIPSEAGTEAPIAAEATFDLCYAPTLRTAEILLEQAGGALDRELASLVRRINRDESMASALQCFDNLIARSAVGLRLLSGWRVAIAGRPNVGKSRLLNTFAGYTRSIVDPTPGTTRDIVTVSTALEGWPIEFSDTAGLRTASDPIEAEGIARSRREQSEADLVLVVLDRSEALQPIDFELVASAGRAIVVANKSDLPAAWQPGDLDAGTNSAVTVSAERSDGIPELCGEIVQRLVPRAPGPGDAVPFRPRHVQALERASQCLNDGDRSTAKTLLESLLGGS